MNKKLLITVILLSFAVGKSFCQTLPELKGWKKETFALPPAFASSIPINGTEDIRFSPEWAKNNTDGYWTYCFLWTLKDAKPVTAADLEKYLHDYYTGLIKSNLKEAKIDPSIATPVSMQVHEIAAAEPDKQTFEGRIKMMDYMTQNPIKLNFRIHIKKQTYKGNVTAIFFEASPQPYSDKLWVEMDGIGDGIK